MRTTISANGRGRVCWYRHACARARTCTWAANGDTTTATTADDVDALLCQYVGDYHCAISSLRKL